MPKDVAKFRKNRDYNDDFSFEKRKKPRSSSHNPNKRVMNYDYEDVYQDNRQSKRKSKNFSY